jgi:hypothetical protein
MLRDSAGCVMYAAGGSPMELPVPLQGDGVT